MAPTREGADYQNYSPYPAQPAQLGGAVSVTLVRRISDVTWGNKAAGERKGEEEATLLLPLSTCAAREMAS